MPGQNARGPDAGKPLGRGAVKGPMLSCSISWGVLLAAGFTACAAEIPCDPVALRGPVVLGMGASSACAGPRPGAFTSDPDQRGEYLAFYRRGFEAALMAHQSSWCNDRYRWHGQDPLVVARMAGWAEGQDAGFLVWCDEMEEAAGRRDRDRLFELLGSIDHEAAAAAVEEILGPE